MSETIMLGRKGVFLVGLTIFSLICFFILSKLQCWFFLPCFEEENLRTLLKNAAAVHQLEAAQQDLEKLAKFRAWWNFECEAPQANKQEEEASRVRPLLQYYESFDLADPLRNNSMHWYVALERWLFSFDQEGSRTMNQLVVQWRPVAEDPHKFSDEEKVFIKRFMRISALDTIPPQKLIHLLSRIEADVKLDPQVLRDVQTGELCLTQTGAPLLMGLEMMYITRVREYVEHELGVQHFDRYYRIALLEFYHQNKNWLKNDAQLSRCLESFTRKQFGLKDYPDFSLEEFKKFPLEQLPLRTTIDLSEKNAPWVIQKNVYLYNYALRQMETRQNFNAILVESGLCDFLELERYRIKYLVAREREALEAGNYAAFKEKYNPWLMKLKNFSNFSREADIYRYLERDYLYFGQLNFLRTLDDILYRKLFGKEAVFELVHRRRELEVELRLIFLLDHLGYLVKDPASRFVVDYIVKYDWWQFRNGGQLNPAVSHYLATLDYEGVLLEIQKSTKLPIGIIRKFYEDHRMFLDFLLINRFVPEGVLLLDESMYDPMPPFESYADPFLAEPFLDESRKWK